MSTNHPRRQSFIRMIVAFVVVIMGARSSRGQLCFEPVSDTLTVEPVPGYYDGFGESLDVSGNLMAVGSPRTKVNGIATGSAFIYLYDAKVSQWVQVQQLTAFDGAADDYFGISVAIDGGVIVVGSMWDDDAVNNAGAAYVFEFNGSRWEFRAKLQPSFPLTGEQVGISVAIHGDVIVVGSNLTTFAQTTGSAFVFRKSDGNWNFEKRLQPDDGVLADKFGSGVAVMADAILVGSREHDAAGQDAGAVYVFRFVNQQWVQTQKLLNPIPYVNSAFGTSIACNADRAVIGAPGSSSGSATVWLDNGTSFTLEQSLEQPDPQLGESFGTAVAIDGSTIAVGARLRDWIGWGPDNLITIHSGGAAYWFQRHDNSWTASFTARESEPVDFRLLGKSVAVGPHHLIAGAEKYSGGMLMLFGTTPDDCDGNGSPDNCEPDCNRNNLGDVCELLDLQATDCNINGLPDECDAEEFTYRLDQDQTVLAYGYGYFHQRDFLWMNQYNVIHGGEVVTHLAVPYSPFQAIGNPITALLYSDPNQDGNPADAQLLASVEGHAFTDDEDLQYPVRVARLAIPPTYVGEAGDSFFVGAFARIDPSGFPAYVDGYGVPGLGRSWYFSVPLNTINVGQPGAAATTFQSSRKYWLRALSLDCNGNGSWDQCDIDSGFSIDLNANGIPDECDAPCDGDIAGGPPGPGGGKGEFAPDGQVAIDDLLVVINHWDAVGPPGGPGDIAPPGGDGVVNIDDLLVIINTWGVCP